LLCTSALFFSSVALTLFEMAGIIVIASSVGQGEATEGRKFGVEVEVDVQWAGKLSTSLGIKCRPSEF
jgi:hypothetical protein